MRYLSGSIYFFIIILQWNLGAMAAPSAVPEPAIYPDPGWERVMSVEKAGYSSEKLKALDAHVESLNTHSVMAVVGGKILWSHGDLAKVSYIASVRKSVLAMMYGKFVRDGTIDLDKTLADLGMDDVDGLMPIEKQARIRDLIAARSGVYHRASNSGDNSADAPPRGSQKPGSYFLYNNWDFNAAGAVFEKLTGKNIFDALEMEIARPLGLQDFDRKRHKKSGNAKRSRYLAYHMHFSTRDMARIGYVMLRHGKWKDGQVVDADWAAKISSPITQSPEMNPESVRKSGFDYGFMWWVLDDDTRPEVYHGAYAGRGHYGQYILVIPELDMVIAHKTLPVKYKSREEYLRIRVSWKAFMSIVERLVAARQ